MADLFSQVRLIEEKRIRLRVLGYKEDKPGYVIVGWITPDGRRLTEDAAFLELAEREAKQGKDGA